MMANELCPVEFRSRWIGLLTHEQKQAGFCVLQDDDFVWLWKVTNGDKNLINVFPYETVTIKEIRDKADEYGLTSPIFKE